MANPETKTPSDALPQTPASANFDDFLKQLHCDIHRILAEIIKEEQLEREERFGVFMTLYEDYGKGLKPNEGLPILDLEFFGKYAEVIQNYIVAANNVGKMDDPVSQYFFQKKTALWADLENRVDGGQPLYIDKVCKAVECLFPNRMPDFHHPFSLYIIERIRSSLKAYQAEAKVVKRFG
jgi:hypothetical protein